METSEQFAIGYSANGFITWQVLPQDQLKPNELRCTEDEFNNFRDYYVVNGALVKKDPLADAKRLQTNMIIGYAERDLSQITGQYPPGEVSTWDQQYAEAVLYKADPKATAPILSAIAAVSGRTVADTAETVIAKASAYKAFSGAVIGKRIALTSKIDAALTVEAVQLITWE